jgi:hypothetical protein
MTEGDILVEVIRHFAAASTFNQAMKKTELNLPIIAFPQLAHARGGILETYGNL